MKVGIVGLPGSGKSTLFNALTKGSAETGRFGSGRAEINRGRITVPDSRPRRAFSGLVAQSQRQGVVRTERMSRGEPSTMQTERRVL